MRDSCISLMVRSLVINIKLYNYLMPLNVFHFLEFANNYIESLGFH